MGYTAIGLREKKGLSLSQQSSEQITQRFTQYENNSYKANFLIRDTTHYNFRGHSDPQQPFLFFSYFCISVKLPITLFALAAENSQYHVSINISVFQQKHANIK